MEFLMEQHKDKSHHVTINIPKITVNNAVLQELINISRKANINGFRKGKVPIQILQKKYGDNVYYDVFNRLMQKFFYKFIDKEKIKIIGFPKYYIHNDHNHDEESFKYSVNYELYPKLKIQNLELIKIKKININVTDSDIKKNIEKHIKTAENWSTVNSSIKIHDRVTIDYDVYENYHKIKKFTLKNIVFTVSDNTFLSELNSKIINHYIKDIIFFKIKCYRLHPEKELQNKDITFKITIKKIERKQDVALEDKIIKNIEQNKTYQSHYQNIKKNISEKIQLLTKKHFQSQIIKQIIKENPISIPPLLLQEEIKILYNKNIKKYIKNKDHLLEKKYYINLTSKAKKRLHIQIIIEQIIADNNLSVDTQKIQSFIQMISKNHKKPLEVINLYNNNKDLKNSLKNIILEIQVMDFLTKKIQIIETFWTFEKFINYNWKKESRRFI